jgi:hypothetical protein
MELLLDHGGAWADSGAGNDVVESGDYYAQ